MEKSIVDKTCNSIGFKTYNNMIKGSFISSLALGGASALIDSPAILDGTLSGLALTSLGVFMVLAGSGGLSKTRDINELRDLYNEFLDNYVKLNETFDFTNPVQIAEMYSFLLYKGYLSKDKEFTFTSNRVFDKISAVDGANIANGHGVCRHIAGVLTDILNKSGIESDRLCVYAATPEIVVRILKEKKYSLEELYEIARRRSLDEKTYAVFCRLIKEYAIDKGKDIEFDFRLENDKNPIKHKIGNHTISYAKKDGIGYYLDPTGACFYVSDGGYTLYDSYHFPIEIKMAPSIIFNDYSDFKKMQSEVGKIPCLPMEEISALKKDTDKLCKDNLDVFENFYQENQELYGEISAKVLQLKR